DYKCLDDPFGDLPTRAAEGTLFIREIAELSAQQQRNLLALLPSLERGHTRLIASSCQALPRLVSEGRFDSRLLAAVSQTQLRVPSLREHAEDIPELARLMLGRMVESKSVPPRTRARRHR